MSDWSVPARDGRAQVLDLLVLVGTLAVALLPILPVYGPEAAWLPIVGGLVLGAALAWTGARLRWSGLVTSAVGVLAYLVLGAGLAAPTTAAAGMLPTTRSVALLLTGAVTVWKQVLTLDPALGQTSNLLVAPYLLAVLGSATAVTIALRATPRPRGAWAAAIPLVVLVVAVLLGTKESIQPVAAGVLMAVLLLPWAAWRREQLAPRRVGAALAVLAVAGVSGAVAGPVVVSDQPRFVLRDELVPPFDPRDQASPLSAFRKFVKEWGDTPLVTVRGLPEGAAVRLATLDAFDGVVWNVAGAEAAQGSGQFRRVGETIQVTERGASATVELEVHDLPMVWLPTVGYAERFEFDGAGAVDLSADLRYNDATGGAVLTRGVPAGTSWTVDVVVPSTPGLDELGTAQAMSVRLPEPTGVPQAVPLSAGEIAGSASTPALIARSLAQGLAQRGYFSHGLTSAGDYPSASGHGADRVTTLLTSDLMVGDAEQYASAMALMAREMGLPARVVLGFRPDEEQAGSDEITFTGSDIDAWVEIAFTGYGWVAFSPTPDEAKTPQDDTQEQQTEPQPQVRQPPPPPPDAVDPPDDDTEQPRTEDTEQDLLRDTTLRTVLLVAATTSVPLVVIGAPLLLIAAAKRRRRRRRRTEGATVAQVVGGWDELLDQARDLRRPPPELSTRRETAVHLARAFAVPGGRVDPEQGALGRRTRTVGGPVAGLAAGADALVFGPGEPTPAQVEAYWAQVDVAVSAMRAALPRRSRWAARYSVASLVARRRLARRAATD